MTIAWIAPAIVTAIGGWVCASAIPDLRRAHASRRWLTTRARVLSVGYHPGSERIRDDTSVVIRYEYAVAGRRHESERYSYAGRGSGTASAAAEVGSRYRPGEVVSAYYDPRDPRHACLAPGAGFWNYALLAFGLLLLLPGALWLLDLVA